MRTTSAVPTRAYMGENFARNLALVDKVRALADAKHCTPAQLALAWVLARGPQRRANSGHAPDRES
ncbi:hypothetical protein ACTMU2_00030 [Cupriavidus basilensis]